MDLSNPALPPLPPFTCSPPTPLTSYYGFETGGSPRLLTTSGGNPCKIFFGWVGLESPPCVHHPFLFRRRHQHQHACVCAKMGPACFFFRIQPAPQLHHILRFVRAGPGLSLCSSLRLPWRDSYTTTSFAPLSPHLICFGWLSPSLKNGEKPLQIFFFGGNLLYHQHQLACAPSPKNPSYLQHPHVSVCTKPDPVSSFATSSPPSQPPPTF